MMEAGNEDRPKPGNVSSAISCSKKMENSSLELDFKSYNQNLLKFECEDAAIRDNGCRINFLFGVMERFSENLTQEPDDSYRKIDSIRANVRGFQKRGLNGDDVEARVLAGTECCSSNLTLSLEFSDHMNCSRLCENDLVNSGGEVVEGSSRSKIDGDSQKCQLGFPLVEVDKLRIRLEILEEDNQVMKKAFFAAVEERSELLTEISQQFQIIHQHLRNRTFGETSSLDLLMSSNKDESMGNGLSEVLHQDSNPSLVTRVLKANIVAFQVDQDLTATGAT